LNTLSDTERGDAKHTIERYYRWHSPIYDATRWSFLFGRRELTFLVTAQQAPRRILEVGCGTGKNLRALARAFPDAELVGLDASGEMLRHAEKSLATRRSNTTLHHRRYEAPLAPGGFDLVVFSYALSMFNPGWQQAIEHAHHDLAAGGIIAVVDFHSSPFPWFARWMALNHVRMQRHLLPLLQQSFQSQHSEVHKAYAGLWQYFVFLGVKRATAHSLGCSGAAYPGARPVA
jgi:S-adenosylmethionine-diacylgycerolhomoserine-N-methlytransferase